MSTRVEKRMTPQGKAYLCLVMGDGQFPPNISLRTAEAALNYLEDVKRFVEKKVDLCSRLGVPLPAGGTTQVVSDWQNSGPATTNVAPQPAQTAPTSSPTLGW